MEPGPGARPRELSPHHFSQLAWLHKSLNPAYLRSGNGSPWLQCPNAQTCHMPLRNASCCCCFPLPMLAIHKGREERTLSARSVWLELPPSTQSMNGQRLLMKSSLARSPFSLSWGPPSFVWIWEDGLGTVPSCLFMGLPPRRLPFLFRINRWETWN